MKCPNCNKKNANDSRFCEYCGAKLFKEKVFSKNFLVGETNVIGLENMTINELRNEVSKGGRFLRFPYTISLVLVSFKLSSDVYFVRHNEKAISYGAKYAVINLLLGWWGFPFGLIYTPLCIKGSFVGKDVTKDIMPLLEVRMNENI